MAVDKAVDSAVLDGYFEDIADSIRTKINTQDTYTPAQMSGAIDDIPYCDLSDYFTDTITSGGSNRPGYISSVKGVMPPKTVVGDSLIYAYNTYSADHLDLSQLDTSNVITMQQMCDHATFKTIDVTNMDTSNVTNMSLVFSNCQQLTNITGLTSFNTEKVENFSAMFRYCKALTTLDLSSFDFGAATNITNMFDYCNALENVSFGSNLGKAYPADASAAMATPTTLTFSRSSNLTAQSIINIVNSLYDISNITNTPQWVTFHNTAYNRLTQEQKDSITSVATTKGWEIKY